MSTFHTFEVEADVSNEVILYRFLVKAPPQNEMTDEDESEELKIPLDKRIAKACYLTLEYCHPLAQGFNYHGPTESNQVFTPDVEPAGIFKGCKVWIVFISIATSLREALEKSISKDQLVDEWLQTPNDAFDEATPISLIEKGDSNKIWEMIHSLDSGEPG